MTAGGLVPSQTYKDLAARADNTAVSEVSSVVLHFYITRKIKAKAPQKEGGEIPCELPPV